MRWTNIPFCYYWPSKHICLLKQFSIFLVFLSFSALLLQGRLCYLHIVLILADKRVPVIQLYSVIVYCQESQYNAPANLLGNGKILSVGLGVAIGEVNPGHMIHKDVELTTGLIKKSGHHQDIFKKVNVSRFSPQSALLLWQMATTPRTPAFMVANHTLSTYQLR